MINGKLIRRDGVRNLLRSGGRTPLFLFLILASANLLILSSYARSRMLEYLQELDKSYKTIGVLEYRGGDYPTEKDASPGILQARADLDWERCKSHPAVKGWQASSRQRAFLENFESNDPKEQEQEVVVLLHSLQKTETSDELDRYSCVVSKALFSPSRLEGKQVYLNVPRGTEIEKNKKYLLSGKIMKSPSPIKTLNMEKLSNPLLSEESEKQGGIWAVAEESGDLGKNEAEKAFQELALALQIQAHHLQVEAVHDLEAVYLFHQGLIHLVEGRPFTEAEIQEGQEVCIVSEYLASQLSLQLGDSLSFRLIQAEAPEKWTEDAIFAESLSYRIVGIKNSDKMANHVVYLPDTSHARFAESDRSYRLGTFILQNDQASTFEKDILPLLPDRVYLDIYDQGYAAVSEPYRSIYQLSQLILGICFVVTLAVLIFFAYFYVYRQRENAIIMIRLGVSSAQVRLYQLFSGGTLLFAASVLALGLAMLLSENIDQLLQRLTSQSRMNDLRYSNIGFTLSKEQVLTAKSSLQPLIGPAFFVILLGFIILLVFTLKSQSSRNKSSLTVTGQAGARTSVSRSRWKWVRLSLVRNGARNILAFLAIIFCVVFLIYLLRFPREIETALNQTIQETKIKGYFTDIYGRRTGAIPISEEDVKRLEQSEMIEDIKVSGAFPYRFLGIKKSGQTEYPVAPLEIPGNPFSLELFLNDLLKGPDAVYTNDFAAAPEFYYSRRTSLDLPEGSETIFAENVGEQPYPLVLPQSLMERENVKTGDIVRIALVGSGGYPFEFDFEVKGSFQKAGKKENIYLPEDMPRAWMETVEQVMRRTVPAWKAPPLSYLQSEFHLKQAKDLNVFKDYLNKQGYSSPGFLNKDRQFIVLEDRNYLENVRVLKRQQQQISFLYPILSALVLLIGVILPMLLMNARRKEVGIMRSLGTRESQTAFTFLGEHVLILIPALAIGLALSGTMSPLIRTDVFAALAFALLWLTGVSVQLIRMLRQPVLKHLHEE